MKGVDQGRTAIERLGQLSGQLQTLVGRFRY
jgi:hypothetical protein